MLSAAKNNKFHEEKASCSRTKHGNAFRCIMDEPQRKKREPFQTINSKQQDNITNQQADPGLNNKKNLLPISFFGPCSKRQSRIPYVTVQDSQTICDRIING